MTSARSGLTRRDVLGGLAAAGAGALLASAAATAAAMPARRLSRLRVGAVDGLSPVLAPGRAFVLAGVQWSSPTAARIELRSRFRGGAWGPWGLASVRGHEPDHGTDARMVSCEPLWLGPADQVQTAKLAAGRRRCRRVRRRGPAVAPGAGPVRPRGHVPSARAARPGRRGRPTADRRPLGVGRARRSTRRRALLRIGGAGVRAPRRQPQRVQTVRSSSDNQLQPSRAPAQRECRSEPSSAADGPFRRTLHRAEKTVVDHLLIAGGRAVEAAFCQAGLQHRASTRCRCARCSALERGEPWSGRPVL